MPKRSTRGPIWVQTLGDPLRAVNAQSAQPVDNAVENVWNRAPVLWNSGFTVGTGKCSRPANTI